MTVQVLAVGLEHVRNRVARARVDDPREVRDVSHHSVRARRIHRGRAPEDKHMSFSDRMERSRYASVREAGERLAAHGYITPSTNGTSQPS